MAVGETLFEKVVGERIVCERDEATYQSLVAFYALGRCSLQRRMADSGRHLLPEEGGRNGSVGTVSRWGGRGSGRRGISWGRGWRWRHGTSSRSEARRPTPPSHSRWVSSSFIQASSRARRSCWYSPAARNSLIWSDNSSSPSANHLRSSRSQGSFGKQSRNFGYNFGYTFSRAKEPRTTHLAAGLHFMSGADRDRTGDPLLAKQVLSQLSYRPEVSYRSQDTRLLRPLERAG